jgi:D-arabinose 1-dehydrogenase-like Zn-dependent alcohol dehydrogenase
MLSATSTTREELRLSLQLLRHGDIRAMFGPRFALSRANQALALVQAGAVAGRVLLMPGS